MDLSDKKTRWIKQFLSSFLFFPLLFVFFNANVFAASKTILVFGDSLSAEYRLLRGTGWVTLLEQRLAEKNTDIKVVNASVSGETTGGGIARLPALLKQHTPRILILELGVNDGLRGLSIGTFRKNLRAMVAMAKKANCRVLILGMWLPPNDDQAYAAQFAAVYRQVSGETRVPLVPFFLKGVAEKEELLLPDHLHPAEAAQPLLLENVWPSLLPLRK